MTWSFWIDVGGTFTDCIVVEPKGIKGGKTSQNILISNNKRKLLLPLAQLIVNKGDQIIIKTSGGGGFGKSKAI